MKKKYYFILLFVILITSALYILLGKGGTNPQVVVNAYNKEWGIEIPQPTAENIVYASETSEDGVGQWATIYSYEEAQDLSKSHMEKLTAENVTEFEQRVDEFETKTLALLSDEAKKKQQEIFEDNKPKVEEGDYGFYKEKNEGKSYFLTLYHDKDLYTYTWHAK